MIINTLCVFDSENPNFQLNRAMIRGYNFPMGKGLCRAVKIDIVARPQHEFVMQIERLCIWHGRDTFYRELLRSHSNEDPD
jgi:hypothetical protein